MPKTPPVRLVVQIPCFNEEKTLPVTLKAIPRRFRGVGRVEILVIDDGSSDRTVDTARKYGADHVIRLTGHQGLARAFSTGVDAALKLGADIVVNTDADNQYCAADIQKLIDPILSGEADMVVGERDIRSITHFSAVKKGLQRLGSFMVRRLSGTEIPDTTSGFRAMSKEAALRLHIVSRFTYTLETIIQAGKKNITLASVPVRTNAQMRPSRLFSSMGAYIRRSTATMVRIYTLYEPLKLFFTIGAFLFGFGFLISVRFLYFYCTQRGTGHVQSLILAAVLMIVGFQVIMIGLLSDVLAAIRSLIEDVLHRVKKMELMQARPKRTSGLTGMMKEGGQALQKIINVRARKIQKGGQARQKMTNARTGKMKGGGRTRRKGMR
jgi:glycosyltransferase involved in cell wall biosynthesis